MRMISRLCYSILLLLASSSAVASETALHAAIDRYIGYDCAVGQTDALDQELLAHGDAAIPRLQQLLDAGPDAAALETMRVEIERHWEARREFLESSEPTGLSIESQQNVTLRDRESYLDRRLNNYLARVRERAALGLAAIGSPAARRALVESATGQEGELSDLIERLISPPGRLRERGGRRSPAR
jgi:hypothetical protein